MSRLQIARAARTIRAGGVIAYPTEAVYGLGCLPENAHAVQRILALKRRPVSKGLLLIAATMSQVEALAELPAGEMRPAIEASWPGPVTWVLPARPDVPAWITGGRPGVGIRLTDHPIASALCEQAGSALVSTSANVSGRPPIRRIWQLRGELGRSVDYVLGGPVGGRETPSIIRDGRDGRVLRA